MARDVPGVVATAMTELDSTPPNMRNMRVHPQVAEDLQTQADEAMSESGFNSGHGIPGRQKTESCIPTLHQLPQFL